MSGEAHLVLVIGPPGAGKTTWIAAQDWPGRWFSVQAEALLGAVQMGPRRYTNDARAIMRALAATTIEQAARRRVNVVIEGGGETVRARAALLARFPAPEWRRRIVAIVPADPAIAIARAKADPLRPPSRWVWEAIVRNWYRRWEPVGADEADLVEWIA